MFSYLGRMRSAHAPATPAAPQTDAASQPAVPPAGAIIELSWGSSCARTTLASLWLRAAQGTGAEVAWIEARPGLLYPPDLAAQGIDLARLTTVRIPAAASGSRGGSAQVGAFLDQARHLGRAAELLIRTGAYRLVVVDMMHTETEVQRLLRGMRGAPGPLQQDRRLARAWSSALQGRLAALVRKHQLSLVVLSTGAAEVPSLGHAVSLRLGTQVHQGTLRLDLLKDKLSEALRPQLQRMTEEPLQVQLPWETL